MNTVLGVCAARPVLFQSRQSKWTKTLVAREILHLPSAASCACKRELMPVVMWGSCELIRNEWGEVVGRKRCLLHIKVPRCWQGKLKAWNSFLALRFAPWAGGRHAVACTHALRGMPSQDEAQASAVHNLCVGLTTLSLWWQPGQSARGHPRYQVSSSPEGGCSMVHC